MNKRNGFRILAGIYLGICLGLVYCQLFDASWLAQALSVTMDRGTVSWFMIGTCPMACMFIGAFDGCLSPPAIDRKDLDW